MPDPLDRLRPLAGYADVLESADFDFGHWVPSRRLENGSHSMPYFEFSEAALEFLAACPVEVFDWPAWHQTEEAQALMHDRAVLGTATPDQLIKLLTALIRGDRFTEGNLAEAFEAGLLAAIARRASELINPKSARLS
jgi:hypothetical protein